MEAKLPMEERATLIARQGVRYPVVEGHMVADPQSLKPVPRNGKTIGEIMVRGNTVMLGYLKEPKATAETFRGGWMHTGDLAVEHPDGYIEIKDRASSSPVAKTSRAWRSRSRSTSIPPCSSPPWWHDPTRNGARHPAPSSSSGRERRRQPTT
jgi:acyl-CoA synthetase (AMP-forming)/AMP-acid ligase II